MSFVINLELDLAARRPLILVLVLLSSVIPFKVSSLSEASIERNHLAVQVNLQQAGNFGRSAHAADREVGRADGCKSALASQLRSKFQRNGPGGDIDKRIRKGRRRHERRDEALKIAQEEDWNILVCEAAALAQGKNPLYETPSSDEEEGGGGGEHRRNNNINKHDNTRGHDTRGRGAGRGAGLWERCEGGVR